MSVSRIMQQAAAGNAGEAVYVDDVFSTYLYTGNGSTQTITNGIDLAGEGGLVWTKDRERTQSHALFDTERGANQVLLSNSTAQSQNVANSLTSFNSDGFSLGGVYNASGYDIASWTFRKQPGFFDVVTWTGTSGARTLSHNLGTTPGMIIVKSLTNTAFWCVYHTSLGATKYLNLSTTDAAATSSNSWNDTAPTSTEFTVGAYLNQSNDYVAYLFAHDAQDFGTDSDESIIKCGSYTGNTTNKPEIDLGFEPQFVLIKCISASESWIMLDTMRGIVVPDSSGTGVDPTLLANYSIEELDSNSNSYLQLTANGFNITSTGGEINAAGREYIYMAIRRPHKPAEEFAATELFAVDGNKDGSNPAGAYSSGFPVDFALARQENLSDDWDVCTRLMQGKKLVTNATTTESSDSTAFFDYQAGWNSDAAGGASLISWMFRRAPGFFDVVTYTGDGQAGREVSHNLGVAPEMIWFKCRNQTRNWAVYAEPAGYIETGSLNLTGRFESSSILNSSPTDGSVFLKTSANSNYSGWLYIAYLFASTPGISKVGSYTGTGSNVDVNCGFTSGAKFVLVKRTDSTGDWYLWDSDRGIVAGNDPYLLVNLSAAQVTSTDYIDPLSSGFTITSSAPAALNASGGNYIFYAIA